MKIREDYRKLGTHRANEGHTPFPRLDRPNMHIVCIGKWEWGRPCRSPSQEQRRTASPQNVALQYRFDTSTATIGWCFEFGWAVAENLRKWDKIMPSSEFACQPAFTPSPSPSREMQQALLRGEARSHETKFGPADFWVKKIWAAQHQGLCAQKKRQQQEA